MCGGASKVAVWVGGIGSDCGPEIRIAGVEGEGKGLSKENADCGASSNSTVGGRFRRNEPLEKRRGEFEGLVATGAGRDRRGTESEEEEVLR